MIRVGAGFFHWCFLVPLCVFLVFVAVESCSMNAWKQLTIYEAIEINACLPIKLLAAWSDMLYAEKLCLKPFVMSWQLCVSFLIFVLQGGLTILHSLICSNCNLSIKSSFSWHLEYGEVEDKIKWNPVGNLNTTSWKLLAICVNNYFTSEVSNLKYLFPWNS